MLNLLGRTYRCPATDTGVAAVADAGAKGATDAAVGSLAADAAPAVVGDAAIAGGAGLADAGVTGAALGLGDVAAGTTGLGALGGAGLGAETIGAGEVGASLVGAGLADAAIPTVTVTAGADAAAGSSLGLGDLAQAGLGGLGAVGAMNVGSGGAPGGGGGKTSFLPATNAASLAPLSSDMAQSFGIGDLPTAASVPDTGGAGVTFPGGTGGAGGFTDPGAYQLPDTAATDFVASDIPDNGFGQGLLDWAKKNPATLGMLGLSGLESLNRPKLPGAAQTALGVAGTDITQAENVIKSGGTATPIWMQQKAAIDASIDQQIQQQTEALLQSAQNQGMGDKNSPVVQQMLAKMKSDLNVQRQELYMQAMQQNVNNAVAELSGDNQVLGNIAQLQFAQSQEAQQAAAQTAYLALLLSRLQSQQPTGG